MTVTAWSGELLQVARHLAEQFGREREGQPVPQPCQKERGITAALGD
ncbi:hypothetical protein ACFV7R_11850 [Streptomyces sp. NPDC059866]